MCSTQLLRHSLAADLRTLCAVGGLALLSMVAADEALLEFNL
jgi:hypothetical protein